MQTASRIHFPESLLQHGRASRFVKRFHVKPSRFLLTAPCAVRDRTDATAIIRRHSPRGGAPRRTAYELIVHIQNTVHVPLAAVFHRCAGSRNAAPPHVSRETKAHPFHTGLDLMSASYVVVDTEVGSRHIQPRPHRCTHLRRGSLLIEGRTWCQRADDTREILVSCELDSDTPLLRSTCHLDACIEGVGKTR